MNLNLTTTSLPLETVKRETDKEEASARQTEKSKAERAAESMTRDDEAESEPGKPMTKTKTDSPGPDDLDSLGLSHYHEFQRNGQLDDIKKAIEYLTHAVELTSDDDTELPTRLGNLGWFYCVQFQRLGDVDSIDQAITLITRGVMLADDGHTELPTLLDNLGLAYFFRFDRLATLGDLNKAFEYGARAVDLTPNDHPDMPIRLGNLGSSYRARFQHTGQLDDLERVIAYLTRVISLVTEDHPDLPTWLSNLGLCYSDQFDSLGTPDALVKAIEYGSRSVEMTAGDHPDLPFRLNNLGLSYRARFLRFGKLDDLEQAITYISRALDLTPDDHTTISIWLSSLGACYSNRFEHLGLLEDLVKSIEYETRAVDSTPDGHPDLTLRLSNLGQSYRARFHRLGDLEDIEQAIAHISRALASAPENHIHFPKYLSSLGHSHSERFDRLDTSDDLAKAIEYESRAVDLTPDGHPDLPMRLGNLGLSYRAQFLHLGKLSDLEQAIAYMTRSLALAPVGGVNLPSQLTSLGALYSDRFNCLKSLEDLDKAIDYGIRSVELTSDDHPGLSLRLNNLGITYRSRFLHLGALSDAEQAIANLSRAIASSPNDHPLLVVMYRYIAGTYSPLYQRTNDPSNLKKSMYHYRKGTEVSTGSPRERFRCALDWAADAWLHDSPSCLDAYLATMDLLPQLIWLGATTTQRYHDLKMAENLAIKAAAAAIIHSDPALALEWLEHARCVVWTQSLTLRSPLDQLYSSHPELASRLRKVAERLQDASSDLPLNQTVSSHPNKASMFGPERCRLAKEYNGLLAEARALPGFEDFLRPMNAKGLLRTVQNGPAVVINCGERCCDALVIIPGQESVGHLQLPEYNQEKARKARADLDMSLGLNGLRQRGVKIRLSTAHKDAFGNILLDLWKYIVKPVLDFLGLANEVPTGSLPHITWCPTGAMTFLPLHAAGDYNQPRSSVFHYAVSSYTPTLTALPSSTPGALTSTSRVLAVGQTNTPGHNPLPGTAGELESIKGHSHNKAAYTQLTGKQATVTAVLDAMGQHDWVHLACHAHQNTSDPTKSGFYLHDGTLDLASINRKSFRNKGLAFLSACQTATGDETLPDEAIHLASGMLMAGYSSVIATMWSVYDDDAPFVADAVYRQLMDGGKVGNGEAGKALHHAVAALREKVGEKEFEHWVPYIHIGS